MKELKYRIGKVLEISDNNKVIRTELGTLTLDTELSINKCDLSSLVDGDIIDIIFRYKYKDNIFSSNVSFVRIDEYGNIFELPPMIFDDIRPFRKGDCRFNYEFKFNENLLGKTISKISKDGTTIKCTDGSIYRLTDYKLLKLESTNPDNKLICNDDLVLSEFMTINNIEFHATELYKEYNDLKSGVIKELSGKELIILIHHDNGVLKYVYEIPRIQEYKYELVKIPTTWFIKLYEPDDDSWSNLYTKPFRNVDELLEVLKWYDIGTDNYFINPTIKVLGEELTYMVKRNKDELKWSSLDKSGRSLGTLATCIVNDINKIINEI